MANLNGHAAGNGGHGQGEPTGTAPVLDPTFREGDGNVGIIRSPVRAIALPDLPRWPTITDVAVLEEEIGKPVITSSLACIWYAMKLIDIKENVKGFGRLIESLARSGRVYLCICYSNLYFLTSKQQTTDSGGQPYVVDQSSISHRGFKQPTGELNAPNHGR